jgi:hypothetical protein
MAAATPVPQVTTSPVNGAQTTNGRDGAGSGSAKDNNAPAEDDGINWLMILAIAVGIIIVLLIAVIAVKACRKRNARKTWGYDQDGQELGESPDVNNRRFDQAVARNDLSDADIAEGIPVDDHGRAPSLYAASPEPMLQGSPDARPDAAASAAAAGGAMLVGSAAAAAAGGGKTAAPLPPAEPRAAACTDHLETDVVALEFRDEP